MRKQSGAALIVSLIMLLMMTMIGIFAMRTGVMEEKMSANQIDRDLAMKAAEIALREAEGQILSWNDFPDPSPNGADKNVYSRDSLDPDLTNATPWWFEQDEAWWKATGIESSEPAGTVGHARYIIENAEKLSDSENEGQEPEDNSVQFYRITARGLGGSEQSRVILQSVVRLRF